MQKQFLHQRMHRARRDSSKKKNNPRIHDNNSNITFPISDTHRTFYKMAPANGFLIYDYFSNGFESELLICCGSERALNTNTKAPVMRRVISA